MSVRQLSAVAALEQFEDPMVKQYFDWIAVAVAEMSKDLMVQNNLWTKLQLLVLKCLKIEWLYNLLSGMQLLACKFLQIFADGLTDEM